MSTFPTATDVDIALLLEGTFPYVRGGVSSWVNQIIQAFPEYRFGVVFLGSHPDHYGEMRYDLPANVVHMETHYLQVAQTAPQITSPKGDPQAFQKVRTLHEWFVAPDRCPHGESVFQELIPEFLRGGALDMEQFLYSRAAWEFVTDMYHSRCTDPSFVDYFWSVRSMHQPLWVLNKAAEQLIPARVYHSISTGYAGFLGALLQHRTGRPLLLSEHGIYTKERKIDLYQSQWIADNRIALLKDPGEMSYFRQLWIRFFEVLGRLCYNAADPILSLYGANRERQLQDGAAPERAHIIPNGIQLDGLAPLRAERPADPPPILCLIGRVVPIKDIKTFIRAIRTVVTHIPEAEGWIAGPEEEDPRYAEECHRLTESLGLTHNIHFLGFQKIADILPKVGLTVLSSISEAMPLVTLEGYAAGVPSVTTDVGSCRELTYGRDDADKALGASGRVVNIADPQALAEAALELLCDKTVWHAAQQAAIRRVETYYTEAQMFARYREMYENALQA